MIVADPPCLLLHLGEAAPRLPGTRAVALPRVGAVAGLGAALRGRPAPLVLFSTGAAALPADYPARLRSWFAGRQVLAVGLAGAIYPDLFDGLAQTVWRPAPSQVPPAGLPVNELALDGLALPGCPEAVLRRIAGLWQTAPAELLPHLAALVALELHRAGWPRLLLPGGAEPGPPGSGLLPPEVTRAVLEFGGLRHLWPAGPG